ncbi:hypothetical protein BDZ97DRAFT_5961 [Flammula alnicola]|nr:hypothetical protein BDZ97DRAFT_5961 [Flammula alnicola]
MVDHIPLDESRLAATLCEAMCNGIYWVLLYHCTETLVERSKARQESLFRPIFFTSWALFICITGHLVIDIIELFKAFTPQSKKPYCVDANALSPSQSFYLGLDYWTNVTNSAFYITTIMIGDGFLIYRLYIVWSRNRFIIIPPIMFSSGVLATGIMVTYLFSEARAPVFVVASKWITAFFVLTFVCNLYSTFLIGLKIYLSQRRVKNSISFGAGFGKVLEILIESAALYWWVGAKLHRIYLLPFSASLSCLPWPSCYPTQIYCTYLLLWLRL